MEELLPEVELEPLPEGFELPPEDGDSFAANALIKARAAHAATGEATIADDSGIAAEALGGAPGSTRPATPARAPATRTTSTSCCARSTPPAASRRAAYVCALALIDEPRRRARLRGALRGPPARASARGAGGFGYDPAFVPDDTGPERRAHLLRAERGGEERDQPPRPGRAACWRPTSAWQARRAAVIRTKSGAAALSIASNALLIALKLAAGAITGSIAILTEAVHSLIDLVASVVAFVSVRKADEPADADHPYGHEKVESLAATIEGMLILVGAGIIVYEATHRLVVGAEVERLGVGIAVMGFSVVRQPRSSPRSSRARRRRTNRRRWRATPRTCAPTR